MTPPMKMVISVAGCLLSVAWQFVFLAVLNASTSRVVEGIFAVAWIAAFFCWLTFFILGVSALKECFRKIRSERQ